MATTYRIIQRSLLTPATTEQMFRLLQRHYCNVTRADFERDLSEKSDCIVLSDESGVLRGFSTLLTMQLRHDDQPITALFSGDTIVDSRYRSSLGLATAWLEYAFSLLQEIDTPLYWLLITKGFRTYRYLPVYFKRFWPRAGAEDPELRALMHTIATLKFGCLFDAHRGIVRLGPNQPRLLHAADHPNNDQLRNPHVAFFTRLNPFCHQGDELCCCAPITRDNMTRAGNRLLSHLGMAAYT